MQSFEVKHTVFNGILRPAPKQVPEENPTSLELCRPLPQKTFYSVLPQTREDLDDPQNSPSTSMWPYLLATAQTQRLNEISIYAERGTTADKLRFLYLNDFALLIWGDMGKPTNVMGRLRRPPRTAALSFGMPFAD